MTAYYHVGVPGEIGQPGASVGRFDARLAATPATPGEGTAR